MKVFPTMFTQWTKNVVQDSNVNLMVNDNVSPYYSTQKGLRQVDPSAPLFFNYVYVVRTTMTMKAR
jgi:hypothetical protein